MSSKREGEGPLQVLCSGAGYYLGTLWYHYKEDGSVDWFEPNSRESGYFPTKEMAELMLAGLEGGDV